LYRNDTLGKVCIEFKLKAARSAHEEPYLVCTVTDNGVGRAAAKPQKEHNKYVSRGTSLVKERVEYMNKLNYNIQIETFDNYPTGTIVQIQIQYKNQNQN
jgi:two-component sensor histidine kinase